MIKDEKLDFWIKNRRNAIFIGKHGVGKTAKIKAAFDRAGLKWRYFSAATMDPWVDFVGVPRSVKSGDKQVLEMVRPKDFANDEVEAIFFDEFNRSHKKVRDAVMELTQFRSINGEKFKNLKMIWAAINPEDDEQYEVEKLDAAHKDRFQVQVEIPYDCDYDWFESQFGADVASSAIAWWDELPEEEKSKVSPRRLDYALQEMKIGGDMRDILPKSCNVSKLIAILKAGPISKVVFNLMKQGDAAKAKEFLGNENNYASAVEFIISGKKAMEFFLPQMSPEKLASLISECKHVLKFVLSKCESVPLFVDVIRDVYQVTKVKNVHKAIRQFLPLTTPDVRNRIIGVNPAPVDVSTGAKLPFTFPYRAMSGITPVKGSWQSGLKQAELLSSTGTYGRRQAYLLMLQEMPKTFIDQYEAFRALDVLIKIGSSSHGGTITKNLYYLLMLINHCALQGALMSNSTIDALAKVSHRKKPLAKLNRKLTPVARAGFCFGK